MILIVMNMIMFIIFASLSFGLVLDAAVDINTATFSLGSLFIVFSGRRTRSTRKDLMVLMSRPLLFLQTQHTTYIQRVHVYSGSLNG